MKDKQIPALFWKENLKNPSKNVYIYTTKYCKEEDFLPKNYLTQISKKLSKQFRSKVPQRMSTLAQRIAGKKKNTQVILHDFYTFVTEHLRPLIPTTGKPLEQLLDEYDKKKNSMGTVKRQETFLWPFVMLKDTLPKVYMENA